MVRIGILTYFASINYGAFLQAYALQKSLENRYGHIAGIEIINYDSKIAHELYLNRSAISDAAAGNKLSKQYENFIQSRKKLKLSKDKIISDNIYEIQQFLYGKYDIIIVGSDEVWRSDSFRGFPNAYWLNFDLGKTVYMAYAVSGRNDYQEMPQNMREYIRDSIQRFAYIGTRDEVTRRELLRIEGRKIYRNCDPCFLMPQLFRLSDEEKENVRKKYDIDHSQPIVSIMMQDVNAGNILYRMMKRDNHVLYLYNMNDNMNENNLAEASPFEWNCLIAISDLIVTDFFHGTVFSILHQIPFISIEGKEKGRGKIENLLIENNMNDRFVYESDYNGNHRALAMDLYTKGRKAMRTYAPSLARKAMEYEYQKSGSFFEMLDTLTRKNTFGS